MLEQMLELLEQNKHLELIQEQMLELMSEPILTQMLEVVLKINVHMSDQTSIENQ